MTTITIDEITRNAILAALDERAARLAIEIERLETPPRDEFLERACPACGMAVAASETHWSLFEGIAGGYVCPDWQRALVWNIAALHETKQAREIVAEASVPEQADDMTAAKAYADLGYHDAQAAYR